MNDLFNERAMQRLFVHMNKHVPTKRRSLAALLEEQDPVYLGKDGSTYHIKRAELEQLADLLDKEEHFRLKLPIFLMTDPSYGDGYWKVMGKIEVKVLSKFIGREPEKDDEMRVFYPYFKEIRDRFPTATNAIFSY